MSSQTQVHGRKFERFILGLGMSFVLFVLERRVMKMLRESDPRAAKAAKESLAPPDDGKGGAMSVDDPLRGPLAGARRTPPPPRRG